ncbi:hypothetical protein J5X84_28310 [Streptosporangiaceae bacterium NEAU-GS5]|nr:hypothetical protein [Streptosporangiaceae bacterium NEAU-GS5]
MSDGHPTAAQREALRLICHHEPLDAERLGRYLAAARRPSTNPGFASAIARAAGPLAWRLWAQGFAVETRDGWTATPNGRALIDCDR